MINTDTIIIGAGPAGISLASLLSKEDVPFLLLEKSENVGSSWRGHYDRLHLHTVKSFSHLPLLPFPDSYPRYVSRDLLVSYFESYISKFNISPIFNSEVKSITKVEKSWKVDTNSGEYTAKRVVVATGYNNTPYFPEWESLKNYSGNVIHSKNYKNGSKFKDKNVLVIGAGNTGGEIAIDLHENGAKPSICIRSPLRIVPRELFGVPMQISAMILDNLPIAIADTISQILLFLTVPNLDKYGIQTPPYGSVRQVKEYEKIPLIDIGTVDLIRNNIISVYPGIKNFSNLEVEFDNGQKKNFDSIIFCTGYKTGLVNLFKNSSEFLDNRGYPIKKGEEINSGLYFAGFNNHITGFLNYIGIESERISKDISNKFRNKI